MRLTTEDFRSDSWDASETVVSGERACVLRPSSGADLAFTFYTKSGGLSFTYADPNLVVRDGGRIGRFAFDTGKTFRTLGTGGDHEVSALLPEGTSFFEAWARSAELSYEDNQGTRFAFDLIGRDDLFSDLVECLKGAAAAEEPTAEPACVTGECLAADENRGRALQTNDRFSARQQRLIEQHADLESTCRGEAGLASDRACVARDAALDRLIAVGVCWGREGQAYAEQDYHLCRPDSIGYEEAPPPKRVVEGM